MPSFSLEGPRESLLAYGIRAALPASVSTPVELRASRFLADADPSAPQILVGALPFDRRRAANLFQPERIERAKREALTTQVSHDILAHVLDSQSIPSVAGYANAVDRALEHLASGKSGLNKVVLARSLELTLDAALDPAEVARRLSNDPTATVFLTALDCDGGGTRHFVGATPELLVAKSGCELLSHPLAGTARRHRDPTEDRLAGERLLCSDKDLREHAVVVDWIAERFSPWCSELNVPTAPSLVSTPNLWHLGTRIEGKLKDSDTPSLVLADAIHPTPAVCGNPEDAAVALIHDLEGFDRAYFTGAVGWTDNRGDGAWYLAIRCAELADNKARLYAGAGIVRGSTAASEVAETEAKFEVMLRALTGDAATVVTG